MDEALLARMYQFYSTSPDGQYDADVCRLIDLIRTAKRSTADLAQLLVQGKPDSRPKMY